MSVPQCLFFMDLPDLRGLCAVRIFLNPSSSIRDTQIKLCRHLILLYDQILALPDPKEFDIITVIMAVSFYKTRKVQSVAEQKSFKIESPEVVTATQLQACLFYTLTTRLAPSWNKVGHLLIKGSDFLAKSEKLEAVDMCINVSNTQICICIQVQKILLPPCELCDFNIAVGILQRFINNPGHVITSDFIPSKWCYVLPSMKMGQIISIGHNIPSDSPFESYKDFQIHWNALYGYELPDVPKDKVTYCSVYFKPIGEKLFTYPFVCIRSQPIQFYPRLEMETVLDAFICDLKTKMPHLCGFPVRISEKPVYPAKELTRPLSQGNPCLLNLTAKFSSSFLSHDSRYNSEIGQKMVPVKQTWKEQLSGTLSVPHSSSSQVNLEPFKSSPQLFVSQPSCSSVMQHRLALRYIPMCHQKMVQANANHFQITAENSSMLSSPVNQTSMQYNQKNTPKVVGAKPVHPGFDQIKEAKAKPCVGNLSRAVAGLGKAMGAVQQPSSSVHQLFATLCQSENRLVPSVNGAEPSQAHTSVNHELYGYNMEHSSSLYKRKASEKNAEDFVAPNNTEYFTLDANAKEECFHLKYKKCRTKQTVKEVDIEKHTTINELYKLNNSTLQSWLKERGISTKSRERKEQLVSKIVQFLQES